MVIFNGVANINWDTHLPKMYDFWKNIVSYSGGYRVNTLKVNLRFT